MCVCVSIRVSVCLFLYYEVPSVSIVEFIEGWVIVIYIYIIVCPCLCVFVSLYIYIYI